MAEDAVAVWRWAAGIMSGDGVAARSLGRIDPPLHILAEGRQLWCSGGQGARANTMTQRHCPPCLALARDMRERLGNDDG